MQSRRSFIRLSIGTAVPMLLSACAAPQTPASPTTAPLPKPTNPPAPLATAAPTSVPKPAVTSKDPYPSYIPFGAGPKPDYHDTNVLFADGFDTYPANPFKANQSPTGADGVINVQIA